MLNLLSRHPAQDTTRLNFLNQISSAYSKADFPQAIRYADKAIALAELLKNREELADAYRNKGAALDENDKDSIALIFYEQALRMYREMFFPHS